MQSTEKVSLPENGDKSLNEWPTLNDVCTNTKKAVSSHAMKSVRGNRRRNKSPSENSGGYDSSKENEAASETVNGRGARKKSSVKTKWVPVPIVPQPYKKRGYGRHFYDSSRNFNSNKKNESSENAIGQENGRSNMRGNSRFRGKRGRGFSHSWRPRREETSRGEVENETSDITYEAECFYNNAIYYDPFLHNVYASALRDKQLKTAIRLQIEYYFSEDNLVKDIFMRRKMDAQGYVPLTLISTFHRVKNFTKNIDIIIEAVKDSSKLELLDNTKVRPVVDPLKWPLPDNFVGLRSDVPEFVPGQPYIATLIEGMDSLNFSVDEDKYPLSPSSVCVSPDQLVGDYVEQSLNLPYFPESTSPPELNIAYYTETSDPYVDFYSSTPSPDEHLNGFVDYYSEQVSNGVIYYSPSVPDTDEQMPNGVNIFYGSSADDDLSTGTDNSTEDHQVPDNKSPEPTR